MPDKTPIARWTIALALFFSGTPAAVGHDWYHPGCCHELRTDASGHVTGGDCGPADLIKQVAGGTLFRQRITNIEVVVPNDFNKRYVNEHDNDYHVCVAKSGDMFSDDKGVYLYCLYEPQGS